jgi:hypothetical protein
MRKIIAVFQLIFFVTSAFSQKKTTENHLFLLMNDEKSISLNFFENGKINEMKKFDISEKSIYITDLKQRVAILDTSKNNFSLYDVESKKTTHRSVPFKIKLKSIALSNEHLFLGGKEAEKILIQYDIKNEKWYAIEKPQDSMDFVRINKHLIIHDDFLMVFGKWTELHDVIFYNLNSNEKIQKPVFKPLKICFTEEDINQIKTSENYLGLLTMMVHHTGSWEVITIYSDFDFENSFSVWFRTKRINRIFNDFLIAENKLFIADKHQGLGLIKIQKSYFKGKEHEFGIFNYRLNEKKVKFNKIKNGEILHLTKVPNESKIILTIRSDQGILRHEIRNI